MKPPQPTMTPEEQSQWQADIERGYRACSVEGCDRQGYNYETPIAYDSFPRGKVMPPLYCHKHWKEHRKP